MDEPTCEQLMDEDGVTELETTMSPWRHGTYNTTIFSREADGTFWKAHYRLSTDGETNELREGSASIRRCWPVAKQITVYVDTPPPDAA